MGRKKIKSVIVAVILKTVANPAGSWWLPSLWGPLSFWREPGSGSARVGSKASPATHGTDDVLTPQLGSPVWKQGRKTSRPRRDCSRSNAHVALLDAVKAGALPWPLMSQEKSNSVLNPGQDVIISTQRARKLQIENTRTLETGRIQLL